LIVTRGQLPLQALFKKELVYGKQMFSFLLTSPFLGIKVYTCSPKEFLSLLPDWDVDFQKNRYEDKKQF